MRRTAHRARCLRHDDRQHVGKRRRAGNATLQMVNCTMWAGSSSGNVGPQQGLAEAVARYSEQNVQDIGR